MSELVHYGAAIKLSGLSRSAFDRHVAPHVASAKIGKRRMFVRDELVQFLRGLVSSGDAAGVPTHHEEQELCQYGSAGRRAFAFGGRSGTSRSASPSVAAAQSRYARARAAIDLKTQSDT